MRDKNGSGKQRLDVLAAERGLSESRDQARRMIMAGAVCVDGRPALKPGHCYPRSVELTVKERPRYVGRGGEKLDAALTEFKIDVRGLVCLDIGASTGGFTDCLLQRGASKVYAVDVGRGQLDWRLRNDERVTALEGINARYMTSGDLPERAGFACADVSFISLTLILPAVIQLLNAGAGLVTLIKPQFEADRKDVKRGGVVKDAGVRRAVVEKVRRFGSELPGLSWAGVMESPLTGPAGNVEFLAYWHFDGSRT